MMQVTKVWWDGEKLMAEPIDTAAIYKEQPAQQDIQRLIALVRAQQITIDKLEAQRKPLTDEQREEIAKGWRGRNWTVGGIIDAIEAAHGIKEKNT